MINGLGTEKHLHYTSLWRTERKNGGSIPLFFGWGIFWQEKSWEKKYVKNIYSVYFHLPFPFKRKKTFFRVIERWVQEMRSSEKKGE